MPVICRLLHIAMFPVSSSFPSRLGTPTSPYRYHLQGKGPACEVAGTSPVYQQISFGSFTPKQLAKTARKPSQALLQIPRLPYGRDSINTTCGWRPYSPRTVKNEHELDTENEPEPFSPTADKLSSSVSVSPSVSSVYDRDRFSSRRADTSRTLRRFLGCFFQQHSNISHISSVK
jgi:hypothetical protein